MKKKLVALILIGSMALSFTACGNSSDSSKETNSKRGSKGRSQRTCRADRKMGI